MSYTYIWMYVIIYIYNIDQYSTYMFSCASKQNGEISYKEKEFDRQEGGLDWFKNQKGKQNIEV